MRFLSVVLKQNNQNIIRNNCRRFSSLNPQLTDSTSQPVDFGKLGPIDKSLKKKSNKFLNKAGRETIDHVKPDKDGVGEPKGASVDVTEAKDKSVVLRKPIPKNFIKETLLPHLEHNVAYNCMKFPPDVVLQIGIAYSKLPHFLRQRSIEDALIEGFRFRMVDYTALDCIQLLNTCFQLQGLRSIAVYDDIISRLEVPHIYNSINSLNRLGICRSISRIINHSHLHYSNNNTNSDTGKGNTLGTNEVHPNLNYTPTPTDVNEGASSVTGSASTDSYTGGSNDLKAAEGVKGDEFEVSSVNKDVFKLDLNPYHDLYKTSIIKPWSYIVKNYRDKKILNLVERMINFCEKRILPQLERELESFDSDELTDLLAVLAQRTESDGNNLDFPLISILMANIVKLYGSTPLVNSISNLSSLCRLRVRHDGFISLVLSDLRNPLKVRNIYHKHLSRCVWSLARFDLLNDVIKDLLPHIYQNIPKFSPSCYARLSQVATYYQFSDEKYAKKLSTYLTKICLCLLSRIDTFTPKDIIFLTPALMSTHMLPTEVEYGVNVPREIKPKFDKEERYISKVHKKTDNFEVLSKLLEALRRLDAEFDLLEIERLIGTTRSFKEYKYLLDHFPESWTNIINPPDESD